jgi:hypothetical protein
MLTLNDLLSLQSEVTMKRTILCLIVLAGFLTVNAQHEGHNHAVAATNSVPAPENLILKESEFNFGKIPQGKPVTHEFEVMNSGSTSLKIDNVQASCGCTTPQWDRENPIPAGGTSKITVGYNAASEGVFSKYITVTYDGSKSKQITIKGEVYKTPASSAPENNSLEDLKD